MFKFTKSEIYATVIALVEGTEIPSFAKKDGDTEVMVTVPSDVIIDRMNKDIEMANKKSSKTGKPTKTQVENMALKEAMIEAMKGQPSMTIDEIKGICPEISELSTSKVSALLTQLRESGQVERTYVKKKAYFQVC